MLRIYVVLPYDTEPKPARFPEQNVAKIIASLDLATLSPDTNTETLEKCFTQEIPYSMFISDHDEEHNIKRDFLYATNSTKLSECINTMNEKYGKSERLIPILKTFIDTFKSISAMRFILYKY